MCERLNSRHANLSCRLRSKSCPSSQNSRQKSMADTSEAVYDAWLISRAMSGLKGLYLVPGAQRPFNRTNAILAGIIIKDCAFDLLRLLWELHPIRTTVMFSLNLIRSLFPAFRGYSQALIIDEVCSYRIRNLEKY
jgi:hypothetical protein